MQYDRSLEHVPAYAIAFGPEKALYLLYVMQRHAIAFVLMITMMHMQNDFLSHQQLLQTLERLHAYQCAEAHCGTCVSKLLMNPLIN
eukprot:365000-Chlamydomonas_euryale.AAC.4